MLHFVEPEKFPSLETFSEEFGTLSSQEQVVKLQDLLKPHFLRRMKEDVEKAIPPKEETIIEVCLLHCLFIRPSVVYLRACARWS